jgi:hypothetical protein
MYRKARIMEYKIIACPQTWETYDRTQTHDLTIVHFYQKPFVESIKDLYLWLESKIIRTMTAFHHHQEIRNNSISLDMRKASKDT